MSISFNEIPSSLRIPFVAAEIDASQASQGPTTIQYTALLVGQKTASGTAGDDTIHKVTSVEEVITLAGRGSILHLMAILWFANNKSTEVWIGVLADAGGGAAATGTHVITGPATADGTLHLYFGGVYVPVAVTSGDSATEMGDAVEAAVNADLDLPITASNASGTVTYTFRHKGLAGNDYDMRANFNDGEELPAGVGLTINAMGSVVAGTTNPTLTTLIAALGDKWFQVIAHPYTDATSLTAIEGELSDRFGPMRMIDGVAVTSATDTHANLTTLGNGRNSQHSLIMSQAGVNPLTPPMQHAAACAAVIAKYANIDPARPLQTLPLGGVVAITETADLFTNEERNNLLYDGIGTTKVGPGDVAQMERPITTYQTNAAGAADDAYLDVTTMLTLVYLRYSWRVRVQNKYPRHKLADDGTRFGPGQAVVTPKLMKAEALTWFREMEELGLVEGFDQFKADMVIARSDSDPNRLEVLLPPDVINQLIVTATKIAFRL